MLLLRTLGGLSIARPGSSGSALTGRRPLALLSVLAAAAPEVVPRDKVLALLWPEHDEKHARNALNQTLFQIRRALDRPDAVIGRADVRLDLNVVSCDVGRFVAALDRGNNREAVAIYTGPFLDGFFLSDVPEFERWVDETRSGLARRMAGALRKLAATAECEGDLHAAAELHWRLTQVDPLDSAAAFALVRALAATGERARAVQFARNHEAFLQREIGSGVNPVMSDFVMQLLAEGQALPMTPESSIGWPHEASTTLHAAVPAIEENGPGPSTDANDGLAPRVSRPRLPKPGTVLAAVLLLAFPASISVIVRNNYQSVPTGDAHRKSGQMSVAVLPFTVRGAADAQYLRAGLVELISRGIDGAGELRAVDARLVLRTVQAELGEGADVDGSARLAGALRAEQFVLGDVLATTQSLRISASLYDRSRGVRLLASASVDGRRDELLGMIDRLTAQLLAARLPNGRARPSDIAALSTFSLPALKAYLSASEYNRDAQYAKAVDAFQSAVRLDSTFALAWYGLSSAADWAGQSELVVPAARQAARFSGRLVEHDRLLTQAHLAWRENRVDASEQLYQELLHSYPDDAESWYQLGELYFHGNSRRGRSFAESRAPFERVRELDPSDRESLMHLVRIVARTGSMHEIDSLTALSLRQNPGPEGVELRAVRAFALHDTVAQRASLRELANVDGATLSNVAWRVSLYALDIDGAGSVLRLGTESRRPRSVQVAVQTVTPFVLAAQGRLKEGVHVLQQLEGEGTSTARNALLIRALLLFVPVPLSRTTELGRVYAMLDSVVRVDLATGNATDASFAFEAGCFAGLASMQMELAMRAEIWAKMLSSVRASAHDQETAASCALGIRARADVAAGRSAKALNALLAERVNRVQEYTAEVLERFLIAETLFAQHRDVEATRWYTSMVERGFNELPLLAPSEKRLGELAERRGDTREAARHYGLFLRLWSGSDPELQPIVASVSRRLASLSPLPAQANGQAASTPGSLSSRQAVRARVDVVRK